MRLQHTFSGSIAMKPPISSIIVYNLWVRLAASSGAIGSMAMPLLSSCHCCNADEALSKKASHTLPAMTLQNRAFLIQPCMPDKPTREKRQHCHNMCVQLVNGITPYLLASASIARQILMSEVQRQVIVFQSCIVIDNHYSLPSSIGQVQILGEGHRNPACEGSHQ